MFHYFFLYFFLSRLYSCTYVCMNYMRIYIYIHIYLYHVYVYVYVSVYCTYIYIERERERDRKIPVCSMYASFHPRKAVDLLVGIFVFGVPAIAPCAQFAKQLRGVCQAPGSVLPGSVLQHRSVDPLTSREAKTPLC